MKIRKDKDILRFSGIAVLLILAGILIMSFLSGPTYFGIGSVMILMGIIAIVIAIITAATPEEDLIQDERSVRVNEKAGYHAFWILLGTMALLQLINLIGGLNLKYSDVVSALYLVGLCSWLILRWYYNRKGDAI